MSAPAGSYSQMGPPNTANQTHITNPNNVNQTVPDSQFGPTSGGYQNTTQVPSEGRMMDPSGTANPNVNHSNLSTGQGYNQTPGDGQNYAATGQGYNQMPGRDHNYAAAEQPAQTGNGVASCGDTAGKGAHGVFRSIHGAGESLRGNVMSALDNALGHKEGAARNSQIAQAGYDEMQTGRSAARGPKQTNF